MHIQKRLVGGIFFFISWGLAAQTLHLVTEDYPPFNMRVSNERQGSSKSDITGISTDIVNELFKRSGYKYTMKIFSWKRAYNLALRKANYGVFSTTRTKDREKLFQWVGPLVKHKWVFLAKNNRALQVGSVADARRYRIGGYEGDAIAAYLEKELGFKLQLTSYDYLNVHKLANDRIDLWATGHLLGPYLARAENVTGLKAIYSFREMVLSLAFNKSVSPDIISNLNKNLRKMQKDGSIQKIYGHYR